MAANFVVTTSDSNKKNLEIHNFEYARFDSRHACRTNTKQNYFTGLNFIDALLLCIVLNFLRTPKYDFNKFFINCIEDTVYTEYFALLRMAPKPTKVIHGRTRTDAPHPYRVSTVDLSILTVACPINPRNPQRPGIQGKKNDPQFSNLYLHNWSSVNRPTALL